MAAYLWQAFTGEQMYRNGFGRRCFRFEEEWQSGSLTIRDRDSGQMRNEAKIHIVRTEKTVAELRDLQVAQQYEGAQRRDGLFGIAKDAVRAHFKLLPGQIQYVSVLLLDTHWDKQMNTITGHAALGEGSDDIRLAIFGSHALQSYPTSIEEVIPALTDCTRTDTNYVANDCNAAGSNWEAANIGIGAHLHEVGHLFGCPHEETGIMNTDATLFSRTFVAREPYSTRTKEHGARLTFGKDECNWHRLDALRFRTHPCFKLASDFPNKVEEGVQVWPIDQGRIVVTAKSGIGFIELLTEGDEICHTWIEYAAADSLDKEGPPKQVTLTELDLRGRLPADRKDKKLKLKIHSMGQGERVVDNVSQLTSKKAVVKMPKGQVGFRGSKVGLSNMEGSRPEEMLLYSSSNHTLRSIKVYHGSAVDGMEFVYEDSSSQMFGKKSGDGGGSEFLFGRLCLLHPQCMPMLTRILDTRRGEILFGFYVRAGYWIDGIEILTSLGRRSGVFGNVNGGSG